MTTEFPPLSIGAVAGGTSASRAWEAAVKGLALRVVAARSGIESPLAVNVVYQIPGEHVAPDFSGLRTGRFSRRDGRLMVQVALPPEPAGDADAEALALLREAVVLAEEFARERGVARDLATLRALVDRL